MLLSVCIKEEYKLLESVFYSNAKIVHNTFLIRCIEIVTYNMLIMGTNR